MDRQIKLLYTKVQLKAEGALLFQPVGAYWLQCARPRCMKRWLFFFSCVILPPFICLNSNAAFLSFSFMYGLLQSGMSSDRYSLICTVISLG